ncbi:hypothetical protein LTR85_001631 [Meristemomyces frigidus]|nr:hypothetical protein LTR85_001631 [Meristemomyces frigidus]
MVSTVIACLLALAVGFVLREVMEKLKARYLPRPKPKPLSLLGLPGELRNNIYRQVLVSDQSVVIDKDSHAQPALLQACKQMREEASAFYYKENHFNVDCVDLDFTAYIAFYQHALPWAPSKGGKGVRCELSGYRPCWEGLVKGLKAMHEGRTQSLRYTEGLSGYVLVTVHAFQVVEKLKNSPWETVEELFGVYQKVTVDCQNANWQWN